MSHATPIVFVVDDDVWVRRSVEVLVRSEGWQAETFGTVRQYLARPRLLVPSCLVIAAILPGTGGLELLEQRRGNRSLTPVVVTSPSPDVSIAVRAMKAGASDFLTKPIGDGELMTAVRGALERSRRWLGHETAMQALRDAYGSLSRREREVMRLVASGRLNKQVGGELGISEITVKAHRGKAMRKMGASTLADLVNMAVRLRLAPSPPVPHHRPPSVTELASLGSPAGPIPLSTRGGWQMSG